MATTTVLGQEQKIQERIGQLEEMHTTVTGQIAATRRRLEEQEANLARIEGGIIELRVLLNPSPVLAAVSEDKTEE